MTTCVRSAWLTLGALSVPLEDLTAGYACTELDLGWPAIREVINNRPDQHGADDRTRLFGPRPVSANITAVPDGGNHSIDGAASLFAPFMDPGARPVLHYVLDRPGAGERTLTVRAAGYDWPIAGAAQRDIQLAWVAADPYPRDPTIKTATAMAGSSAGGGRVYDFLFYRLYPVGGGSATVGNIRSNGDQPFGPVYRIYGPITAPNLIVSAGTTYVQMYFVSAFTIDAGHYVDLDTNTRSVIVDGDPTKSAYAQVNWNLSIWQKLPPGVTNLMTLHGSSTSGVTQAVATWQDVYLS